MLIIKINKIFIEIFNKILNDLPRMNPLMPLFQKKSVQDIFQRILYVWSVKHPASGIHYNTIISSHLIISFKFDYI